ncbi:MAG: TetR/AcrR family transcriptional regulator [Solirubrobacterales bacterium]|nr:TetR/AcrR family transcriptional regulator [Solirubrobacterales bacterium]
MLAGHLDNTEQPRRMTPLPAPEAPQLQAPRNPTEDAILAAAREGLTEGSFDDLTMDGIARRAFVSRTTVYFYFPNKRAVVDRLIQGAFAEMYAGAAPYLEGQGEPRLELRLALGRVVAVVNRNAPVLLLAAHLSGREDRLPVEWEPYLRRFIGSAARRIRRDQERGVAPADIPAKDAAQALCAMVERHVTVEVIKGGGDANESIRVLSELWWRGVYSRPA